MHYSKPGINEGGPNSRLHAEHHHRFCADDLLTSWKWQTLPMSSSGKRQRTMRRKTFQKTLQQTATEGSRWRSGGGNKQGRRRDNAAPPSERASEESQRARRRRWENNAKARRDNRREKMEAIVTAEIKAVLHEINGSTTWIRFPPAVARAVRQRRTEPPGRKTRRFKESKALAGTLPSYWLRRWREAGLRRKSSDHRLVIGLNVLIGPKKYQHLPAL